MKISITALALMASSTTAFAIMRPNPGPRPEPKKACVAIHEGEEGALYAGNCDETRNNTKMNLPVLENGCAKGQALFTSVTVELPACRDPRIVQL